MTTGTPRPAEHANPLHEHVTVAHASPEERARLVSALAAAPGGAVIDLTPGTPAAVTAEGLAATARSIAAQRRSRRHDEQRDLDAALRDALAACDRTTQRRDAALATERRVAEGITFCAELRNRAEELTAVVAAAAAEMELRLADQRRAEARLELVREQRAAAAAAIADADPQLDDLESASLDDPSIRRQLEDANRVVQDARATEAATRAALDEVTDIEERLRAELARVEAEWQRASEAAMQPVVDCTPVRTALAAYEAAATAGTRDPAAQALAAAWTAVARDLHAARAALPDGPSSEELAAAENEVRDADAALLELDSASAGRLTSDQRAALDAAHAAVLEAEERAGRGLNRATVKKQLDQAREQERLLLEEAGFESYLDVVLTGGRRGRGGIRLAAEQRYQMALRRAEELRGLVRGGDEVAALETEQRRLWDEIAAVLGVDPGERVTELLEAHPPVPRPIVAELAQVLDAVDVRPVGVSLDVAAREWLAGRDEVLTAQRDLAARLAACEAAVARVQQFIRQVEAEVAAATAAQEQAAAGLESANRTVAGLEAELQARTGQKHRRVERMAAAEQLRAQVAAVEVALREAEAEAAEHVRAAADALTASESRRDKAEADRTHALVRLKRLADDLDRPVTISLEPTEIETLAATAAEVAEQLAADVERAEKDLADATATADAAARAAHATEVDGAGISTQDQVEALVRLIEEARPGRYAVLDDALRAVHPSARDEVLDALLVASAHRPVVVLTDDPDLLGWAIALPAPSGRVTTAEALLAGLPEPRTAALPADPTRRTDGPEADVVPTPPSGRNAGLYG